MSHAALELPKPDAQQDLAIEKTIGELVATAAGALMQGLAERFEEAPLSCRVKDLCGDAVAQLYVMRQFGFRSCDFDQIARREGKRALRERLAGAPVTPTEEQLSEWISWPLDILSKVVKARSH
jgi:hypothetical protein